MPGDHHDFTCRCSYRNNVNKVQQTQIIIDHGIKSVNQTKKKLYIKWKENRHNSQQRFSQTSPSLHTVLDLSSLVIGWFYDHHDNSHGSFCLLYIFYVYSEFCDFNCWIYKIFTKYEFYYDKRLQRSRYSNHQLYLIFTDHCTAKSQWVIIPKFAWSLSTSTHTMSIWHLLSWAGNKPTITVVRTKWSFTNLHTK